MRDNLIKKSFSYSPGVSKSRNNHLFRPRLVSLPQEINYTHLTSTAYAEDLGDQLNTYGGK